MTTPAQKFERLHTRMRPQLVVRLSIWLGSQPFDRLNLQLYHRMYRLNTRLCTDYYARQYFRLESMRAP